MNKSTQLRTLPALETGERLVWRSTLTVWDAGDGLGCDGDADCGTQLSRQSVTPADFADLQDLFGVTRITFTRLDAYLSSLRFRNEHGCLGAYGGALVLELDGERYLLSEASFSAADGYTWSADVPSWRLGNVVQARLILRPVPVLTGAVVEEFTGTIAELAFDKALDTTSFPPTTAFTVEVEESARTVERVAFAADGQGVRVAFMPAARPGDDIEIAYTPPADSSAGRIEDTAGNAAVGFEVTAENKMAATNPDAPANLTATAGADRQVTLAWELPYDGGSPITEIQYRRKAGGEVFFGDWMGISDSGVDGANAESYTLTELTHGTVYRFQVRTKTEPGGATRTSLPSIEAQETADDKTPPTLESATVAADGTTIALSFSEALEGSSFPKAQFSVVVDDRPVFFSGAMGTGDDADVVTLSASSTIHRGETVVVSYTYTDPNGEADADDLQDAIGNAVRTFMTGKDGVPAVVNNSTPLAPLPPLGLGETVMWEATLTVQDLGSSTYGCSTLCSTALTSDTFSFQGQSYIVAWLGEFDTEFRFATTTFDGFGRAAEALVLDIEGERYLLSRASVIARLFYKWTDNVPDWSAGQMVRVRLIHKDLPPELQSAAVDSFAGNAVELGYDEALDPNSLPPNSAFTVKVNGADDRTVTAVQFPSDNMGVNVAFAPAASVGDAITISYFPPPDAGEPRIQDPGGNAAAGFADRAVENNIPAGIPSPPLNLVATAEEQGDGEVRLAWVPGADGGSPVTEIQYRVKNVTAGGEFGGWISVPESAAGGANANGYTVAGLTARTEYAFEVQALTAPGGVVKMSGKSNQATATPTESVPPVLVGADVEAAASAVYLAFDEPLDLDNLPPTSGFEVKVTNEAEAVRDATVTLVNTRTGLGPNHRAPLWLHRHRQAARNGVRVLPGHADGQRD